MSVATTVPRAVSDLRRAVTGPVVVAGPAYDRARTVAYGTPRLPLAVAHARSATDVARTVEIAREHDLELAVRSGGHSPAGHGTTDGGILLDLGGLDDIDVDTAGRTAWAGAGATAGAYTAAAAVHGLATGFGDTGSVGLGGITLSGGIGYLVRAHGLTIDNLLAADLVTADGRLRRVDARTEPDLFWAIRGGGGNVGVATRFRYRLHEVDAVTGGTLVLPATPRVITRFVAEAGAAPDLLTTIATVMPETPGGRLILRTTLVHLGRDAATVARFRALASPTADTLGVMRYRDVLTPGGGDHHVWAHRTMFLDALDVDAAGEIVARLRHSRSPMSLVQVRVLGGAMARVPTDATAFAHRAAAVMVNVAAAADGPAAQAWVDDLRHALGPRDGAAPGFLGDEGPAGVRAAYPGATWARLAAVKRRHDPTNLFRLNQNVPPARREDS